jgi:16S rRNA (guanine527-N7)-methyltransferase
MKFKEDVKTYLGIELNEHQMTQFQMYYEFLIQYNLSVNLTSITDQKEVYYKHFFDSLTLIKGFDLTKIDTLCDIGAGAGFPSIPLKIVFPHLNITIIDSLMKRIVFLEQLIKLLSIKEVSPIHNRIEVYAQEKSNYFDLVTARALGNMTLICEMGIPLVKIGGHFVAYKALSYTEEMHEAGNAIKVLGGVIESIDTLELPEMYGFRSLIRIKKDKHVNGFPRTYSQMQKKPLK